MIKFSNAFLDEIKARILPSEIIRRKVALKSNGRELTGLCPFHKEKSPSFTVSDEKGFYHCFGCGAHGNIINFLMEAEGLSFPEAVKELAARAGLEMPKMSPEEERHEKQISSLHEIMEFASKWFKEQLYSVNGKEARDYLAKRQLNKQTADIFALGYAPDNRHGLRDFLKTKTITDAQMLECGLLAKNERGEIYDKFRGRLMFPIFDTRGQVIAFGGRSLGDGLPKYLNSPETPLFKKGEVLYNEHLARKISFKTSRLVVTEGYMDVIALYAAGIKEVVAPLGTAITEGQLSRMWNLSKEPIICLDGDSAGQRAMLRVAELAVPLLKPGRTLKFAIMPEGLDPDDVIKSKGVEKMAELLAKSSNLSEVLWNNELRKTSIKTPEARALLESNLNLLANSIKDAPVAGHYRNFFREKLRGLLNSRKYLSNNKILQARITNIAEIPDISIKTRFGAEILAILVILYNPALLEEPDNLEEFINIDLSDGKLENIRRAILEASSCIEAINKEILLTHLEKMGLKNDILYLEGLSLYQASGNDSNDVDKIHKYWKYAVGLYNLAMLREECNKFASELTEESELKASELRYQISKLEENLSQIELAFIN